MPWILLSILRLHRIWKVYLLYLGTPPENLKNPCGDDGQKSHGFGYDAKLYCFPSHMMISWKNLIMPITRVPNCIWLLQHNQLQTCMLTWGKKWKTKLLRPTNRLHFRWDHKHSCRNTTQSFAKLMVKRLEYVWVDAMQTYFQYLSSTIHKY